MLSQESLNQIALEVAKYPAEQKQSAVMAALRIAQSEKGWLSRELVEYVAGVLDMPAIAAYEVATFYNMYDTGSVGRHKITVCTNLPCALMGANEIAEHLKTRLGIGFGETTEDGRFTLKEGECMGACGDAPMCLHNNHVMHVKLTPATIDALLESLE
ncbi:MAG: NADH-quinone oxidoreductase subunit E [Hydrogenophilales bacterium 16-64-46]|nr:MAG: NADH-quinone oxidoreductase subunit E [Hydrogenophilales bacterium 12-64-13]OYZ04926.1 MAG: NADH-quinone oxidoreductase subunit E [Hydrogenophilales bacterium 16-64-46]OZA37569.1 MAG: NADH-quinone oxidoreductase subunit E [Hydrogenophilales bacterium 17-64-34]HQT00838.1 NADH-quinone oxidoreductase subunit NuoE [Thiobacillus sp.]